MPLWVWQEIQKVLSDMILFHDHVKDHPPNLGPSGEWVI